MGFYSERLRFTVWVHRLESFLLNLVLFRKYVFKRDELNSLFLLVLNQKIAIFHGFRNVLC